MSARIEKTIDILNLPAAEALTRQKKDRLAGARPRGYRPTIEALEAREMMDAGLGSVLMGLVAPTGEIGHVHTLASPTYRAIDGFDLVSQQQALQTQMQTKMNAVLSVEANANLSDTEKMASIQAAMNTWASIANLRTNMPEGVSDALT